VRREAVETSMGIKDVISHTSCFSKMNIHRPMSVEEHRIEFSAA